MSEILTQPETMHGNPVIARRTLRPRPGQRPGETILVQRARGYVVATRYGSDAEWSHGTYIEAPYGREPDEALRDRAWEAFHDRCKRDNPVCLTTWREVPPWGPTEPTTSNL